MSGNGVAGFGNRGSQRGVTAAAAGEDSSLEKILIGVIVAAFGLFLLIWFVPPVNAAATTIAKPFAKFFDSRPVRTVLIIGSNRTIQHDVADMLEDIGKSAKAPVRFSVTTKTGKDSTFKNHWESSGVQSALKNRWDHVLLQGEINPRKSNDTRRDFIDYGAKLILAAKASKSQPAMLVSPGYSDIFYTKYPASRRNDVRTKAVSDTQGIYRGLSASNEIALVNVAHTSELMRLRYPKILLYESEDSPSVAGSYMAALVMYKYMMQSYVRGVTFVPAGLDPAAAAAIREVVDMSS